MRATLFAWCASLGLLLCVAAPAHAQYRNNSFGFDVGGWLIQKPSVVQDGALIENTSNRPLRLENGLRLGGETNFKMSADHWWFTGRVNLGFLRFPNPSASDQSIEARYDRAAHADLGTLLGVQGAMGIRYVIFTDRFRPYVQFSMSYLRLFSFSDQADSECEAGVADLCGNGGSSATNFLPHPNVGGVHLQPGFEWIFTRDTAFHLFADVQRWIIFNAADNNAVVLGAGIIFFT